VVLGAAPCLMLMMMLISNFDDEQIAQGLIHQSLSGLRDL